ncbi:MAG TPA: glycine zipper 2TM domain-containing protein [Marinagarivorans sp.]|nr:glycine zipper 2TM domain-containing protein [Marinagarivorans sp.]
MNKQLLLGVGLGVIIATAGTALALRDKAPDFAEVLEVTPIKTTIEPEYAQVVSVTPKRDPNEPEFADVLNVKPLKERGSSQEVCRDQVVTHRRPVQDDNRVLGTATGAIVGGLLGHQVGGGRGKDAATAVGAIAGGVAGNRIQGNMQRNDTYQTTERRCSTQRGQDKVVGYEVTYSFDGVEDVVEMDHKPGRTIPVVNGELVLDQRDTGRYKVKSSKPSQFEVVYSYKGREDMIVLDRDIPVGTRVPVDNGLVDFKAQESGRVLVPREEIRGYDVVCRPDGEKNASVIRLPHQVTVGSRLPMKDGKIQVAVEDTMNRAL